MKNLADKPAYPTDLVSRDGGGTELDLSYKEHTGLTFRERLIVALASNPNMVIQFQGNDDRDYPEANMTAETIINQADAIIKRLEEEEQLKDEETS